MPSETVHTITVFGHKNGWGRKITQTSEDIFERTIGIDKDAEGQEISEALEASQLAFLAAPDTEIRGIIEAHRARLSSMQVLDCATNKGPFKKEFLELAKTASVTSTHPMVISTSATKGQNVIIMPINERSAPSERNAREIYQRLGMELKTLSFERHEDIMAVAQNIPHLIQRLGIHLLRYEIERRGLSYEEIIDIAPANAQITELALGRVGMQRPDVSAGIIHQAFKTDGGRKMMEEVIRELQRLMAACEQEDRTSLVSIFEQEIAIFDPTGKWRSRIKSKTDIHLETIGNLRKKSFSLASCKNEPGLLHKTTGILLKHRINITAIHSHESENGDGKSVRFDIGIEETEIDWSALKKDLEDLGVRFVE